MAEKGGLSMRNIQVAGVAIGVALIFLGLSFATITYAANSGMGSMMAGNSHHQAGDECAWHDEYDAESDCCHDGQNDDGVGAEGLCHDDSEAGDGNHHDETCWHEHDGEHEHSEDGEGCHGHDANGGQRHGMMGHMTGF